MKNPGAGCCDCCGNRIAEAIRDHADPSATRSRGIFAIVVEIEAEVPRFIGVIRTVGVDLHPRLAVNGAAVAGAEEGHVGPELPR